MSPKSLRGIPVLVAALFVAAIGAQTPSRADAERLAKKLDTINSVTASTRRQPLRTTVTEREVNAYLAHEVSDDLPTGVVNPALSILGNGRVSGRAVVDLDRVRQERKPTSLFDPASYLTGRLPVTATGVVTAVDGTARFELESAQVAGVPIPKRLLQQIISYYSRSPERPAGLSIDRAYALPANIREIQVERGQAIVVQ